MSKNVLTIGIVSLVSLLSGVACTLFFTAEALEIAVPTEGAMALADVSRDVGRIRSRMGRVERVLARELAATRSEVREGRFAVLSALESGVGPVGTTGAGGREHVRDAPHVARDDTAPLSSKNVQALGPLADWKTDADLRSRWLFASERVSLDAFGTPDEVAARGTSEWWTYWNVEGDAIASEYRLQFNNGRLIVASLVKWKQPRQLPTAQR